MYGKRTTPYGELQFPQTLCSFELQHCSHEENAACCLTMGDALFIYLFICLLVRAFVQKGIVAGDIHQ